jgi:hypothetical protein
MSACTALTRYGNPCHFAARRGTDRCINHERGADTAGAATRASRAAAVARRTPSAQLLDTALSLTDRASIQAVLDTLIRLELAGRISHDRATIILRACSVAARNFDRSADTLAGPAAQQHDWFPYFEKVHSLLATVDPLLDEAHAHDAPLE